MASINCPDNSVDDHYISFASSDLQINLNINGTFSYLHRRRPTKDKISSCDKIFITPDDQQWNPYCTSFELNERSMLSYAGEISDHARRQVLPINHAFEDLDVASVTVASVNEDIATNMESLYLAPPCALNLCYDYSFSNALNKRVEISKMMSIIGSTNVNAYDCPLFHDTLSTPFDDRESQLPLVLVDYAFNYILSSIGAIQATSAKGGLRDHLIDIWVISKDISNIAINQTTQLFPESFRKKIHANFLPMILCYDINASIVFSS